MNVRDEIIASRRLSIAELGYAQGLALPELRAVPLVPFCRESAIICEIKRASPSKGAIATGLDAAGQAMLYDSAGIRNISVLTEESLFAGSLRDLKSAKAAFPHVAFLRKDFLLDVQDVTVSYLFGADAVLLIASMHDREKLKRMRERALSLGMRALVEVHSADDVDKARYVNSDLTGINSRNLETFKIDMLLPLKIKSLIDWDTKVIFESGIQGPSDAGFAGNCGFDGLLVGESVTRNPGIIPVLTKSFYSSPRRKFWNSLYGAMGGREDDKPLVKICGLVNGEDVHAAQASAADILGFVFADSPRRVLPGFLRSLGKSQKPRVAVVTCAPHELSPEVVGLVEEGYLDAVQFHDDLPPEAFRQSLEKSSLLKQGIPYYKALRVRIAEQCFSPDAYSSARILLDAYSADAAGGTGLRVEDTLIRQAIESKSGLWLAGGLNPLNIGEVVRSYRPELVDASSGIESAPGKKDHRKLKTFVEEAKNA